MKHSRYAANIMLFLVLMLVAGAALAQGGVNDGTGGLSDLRTWFGTILPLVAGIAMSALAIAWGFSWIHGAWIPKALTGLFGSGVAFFVVGLFM